MKQFQAAEITKIILEQGVDFRLTPAVRTELIKAGARPEVLDAVEKNYRSGAVKTGNNADFTKNYEGLVSKAVNQYDTEKDIVGAITTLNEALKINSTNSRAYQLLGYIYLYGLENFSEAEKNMSKAINYGGSAVFRVRHAHDYTFSYSCIGSFYISKNSVNFEGDSNEHTFKVSKSEIKEIKTIGGFGSLLKRKGGIFKVVIRDRSEIEDNDKYDFSPLTGKNEEAKMIVRLIGKK